MSETNPLRVGAPMPTSMGLCADEYHRIRELRIRMQKETDDVKARENELREHMIGNLSKSDDTGAAGLLYRVQLTSKTTMRVSEERGGWPAMHAAVQKSGRFDFLQKRLSDKAVMDYYNDTGEVLPGCEVVHVPDISVTKIKR